MQFPARRSLSILLMISGLFLHSTSYPLLIQKPSTGNEFSSAPYSASQQLSHIALTTGLHKHYASLCQGVVLTNCFGRSLVLPTERRHYLHYSPWSSPNSLPGFVPLQQNVSRWSFIVIHAASWRTMAIRAVHVIDDGGGYGASQLMSQPANGLAAPRL